MLNTVTQRPAGYFTRDELGEASTTFFRENGYLVLEGAVSEDEVEAMNRETVAICKGERGEIRGVDFGQRNAGATSDEEIISRYLCVHFPHVISELMKQHLAHPGIVDVLTQVIGPDVKCMQSMLFVKAAGKPGQAWHQDEDYIPTRDRSLTGAWIALDDANVENGCLWVIPGSHKAGVLYPQYPHDDPRFDCALEAYDFPYTAEDEVPVEVSRGSIVFFNGYLLHRSLPNRAKSGFRRVLVNHYMSAQSFLPWSHEEGVPMAKQDNRGIIMIAGKDPYAWKGVASQDGAAFIRADGDGGCGDGRTDLASFKAADRDDRGKI